MALNFLFKTFDIMKILKWCMTSVTIWIQNLDNDNYVQGFNLG